VVIFYNTVILIPTSSGEEFPYPTQDTSPAKRDQLDTTLSVFLKIAKV
jgi:hypothetical protein